MASVVVGLLGKSGAGKDTVGARLVEKHGFTRVAFADPLKAAALQIDPNIGSIAGVGLDGRYGAAYTLRQAVEHFGWDRAKQQTEIRRFLQNLAEAMRAIDEDIWLNAGLVTILETKGPVVVTDVRHGNEVEAIEDIAGQFYLPGHISPRSPGCEGLLARVVRPGQHGLEGAAAAHISETALDNYEVGFTVLNLSTIDDLNGAADNLARYALDPHRGAGGWI